MRKVLASILELFLVSLIASVHFSSLEDLKGVVSNFLKEARSEVQVVAYGVNDRDIIAILEDLERMGVIVKVVGEKVSGGLEAYVDTADTLLHAKYIVLDKKRVLFGSANFTRNGLGRDLNAVMIFDSEKVSTFFSSVTEWLIKGVEPLRSLKTNFGTFLLIPFVDGEKEISRILRKAKKSIKLCYYAFSDEDIFALLKYLSSRGVSVKMILDDWIESSRLSRLRWGGFDVKIVENPLLHHKFLIVDDKILVFGSANLTESGLHKNVEVIFETQEKDVVRDFIEEFERLWEDETIQGFRI
ncbi:MAG: hypothetical protein B5M49_02825 [Thermotoga sp. 4484_232]|nr:MAG: hypothetical protein B5M49_02825 [Thermotoga sp. 4484_232]RKX39766.1 MAG: phospholipase [Thermotogota bacterium]